MLDKPLENVNTRHHFNSGVYAREMHLKRGMTAETHSHKFDHMSILAQGVAEITVDGEVYIYEAPAVVNIQAEKKHSIHALESTVWFCIHPSENCEADGSLDKILIEEV